MLHCLTTPVCTCVISRLLQDFKKRCSKAMIILCFKLEVFFLKGCQSDQMVFLTGSHQLGFFEGKRPGTDAKWGMCCLADMIFRTEYLHMTRHVRKCCSCFAEPSLPNQATPPCQVCKPSHMKSERTKKTKQELGRCAIPNDELMCTCASKK